MKTKEWEDISSRVSEMQLVISSEEVTNEALTELRMMKDETEMEWKILKEKREKL